MQVVVGGGRMKFNKMEMAVLAGQPGHRYNLSLMDIRGKKMNRVVMFM